MNGARILRLLLVLSSAFVIGQWAFGADTPLAASQSSASPLPGIPAPTLADIPYGEHERQKLDFWQASSAKPTPLVFFMHGGGWVKNDQSRPEVARYLAGGVSVVSIRYRYSWQAQLAGVKPPLEWPMKDAARALQFVRSKAAEWNIDKARIGASGQSAGACTSLWLAFHDDLADPNNADPVARESTRLRCVAVSSAQTTLDPKQMKEWTPNSKYGGGAFGFMNPLDLGTRDRRFDEFLAQREELLPWIREYSPYEQASAGDPPVYLFYGNQPALGQPQKDPTHTANFGVKLKEHLDAVGVPCELVYPHAPDVVHPDIVSYLVDKLHAP